MDDFLRALKFLGRFVSRNPMTSWVVVGAIAALAFDSTGWQYDEQFLIWITVQILAAPLGFMSEICNHAIPHGLVFAVTLIMAVLLDRTFIYGKIYFRNLLSKFMAGSRAE